MKKILDGVPFTCTEDIPDQEATAYIRRGREKYDRALKAVHVQIDGDMADISYDTEKVPFDRIRRITGYLVGTMDRWNSGKRAEEHDRVKHDL